MNGVGELHSTTLEVTMDSFFSGVQLHFTIDRTKLITALVKIYYSGRLNRPLITFQQAGRKWSRAAGLHTLPVLRVPHLHQCAQRSIILWSLIPNSCIVAWILRCSFFMVSTTIFLNSGVYRLFGTPFGIAKHPTC